MQLTINGTIKTVEGCKNLDELLNHLQIKDRQYIAVALDECFVESELYQSTKLKDGQRIEIVSPMQGG